MAQVTNRLTRSASDRHQQAAASRDVLRAAKHAVTYVTGVQACVHACCGVMGTLSSKAFGDGCPAFGLMHCYNFWRQHMVGAALHLTLLLEDWVQPPQPRLANV